MNKKRIKSLFKKYNSYPVQVRASFWFLICSFMQKGISMISTPIFTRLLTTEEYGKVGAFNSWYGIISIIVALHLSSGVYAQGLVKFDKSRAVFSSSLQGLSTILVSFWTIVYISFHEFFNNLFSLTTVQMLCLLTLVWATAVFGFWSSEQRVLYKYRALVIISIIISIAKPVLGVVFVLNAHDKVTARILALAITELVGYSWMYVVQLKRGGKFYSKEFWEYALRFNLPLIPHYLSQTVLNSSDRIMIQRMIGSGEAGIYNLAYSVSLIMLLFNQAIMQTLSPWIYQKIKARRERDIASIAYTSMIIIAGVNLVLILFAPEIVAIFAPPTYGEAIWVIPPVAMSVFFMYCYDLFAKFAFYYEKTGVIMIASVAGAALNIILNYIFISRFGYIAAGYTTLICYAVYSLIHYYFMKKVCDQFCDGKYPYETKNIALIAIPFVAVGFLLLKTYSYPVIRYGISAMAVVIAVWNRKRIVEIVNTTLKLSKKTKR